jgi:hypothetical protein
MASMAEVCCFVPLPPEGDPSDLEAATNLMLEINIWRAKHGAAEVSVNPE